jgi:PTS system galactitol-specific IIA component
MERENNYPTGLEMDGYAVAIPHGDVECIESPFIGITTLSSPIEMYKMDDPKTSVPVQTVFLLGLDNEQTHLNILKEFIKLIQDKTLINYIQQSNSVEDVRAKVSNQIMAE